MTMTGRCAGCSPFSRSPASCGAALHSVRTAASACPPAADSPAPTIDTGETAAQIINRNKSPTAALTAASSSNIRSLHVIFPFFTRLLSFQPLTLAAPLCTARAFPLRHLAGPHAHPCPCHTSLHRAGFSLRHLAGPHAHPHPCRAHACRAGFSPAAPCRTACAPLPLPRPRVPRGLLRSAQPKRTTAPADSALPPRAIYS